MVGTLCGQKELSVSLFLLLSVVRYIRMPYKIGKLRSDVGKQNVNSHKSTNGNYVSRYKVIRSVLYISSFNDNEKVV